MSIRIGAIELDPERTAVRESVEEVGGRDARVIEVTGLLADLGSVEAVEARFDAIADAVSVEDYTTSLSLRSGRRLWVRRAAWQHETAMGRRAGSFKLRLEAREPLEEAENESLVTWQVTDALACLSVSSEGTVPPRVRGVIVPVGEMLSPSLSDGERTIRYTGRVPAGASLEFEGSSNRVLLDGEDVTPYSEGLFPEISPEGTTLTFQSDPAGSCEAEVTIAWRNLWW